MCGREGKSMVLAVKLKENVFLQAEGLGSKTSKGGFTKDKVREMAPSVRRVARQGCGLTCIATASFSQEHFDIILVFLMLHLSVRSWLTVGTPFNLRPLWVFIALCFSVTPWKFLPVEASVLNIKWKELSSFYSMEMHL